MTQASHALRYDEGGTPRGEVSWLKRVVLVMLGALVLTLVAAGAVLAAPEETAPAAAGNLNAGLLGLAAALSVGLGAIGTAWAQSRIGAAAAGAIAERPEISGLMLVFLALPETMIILGFLIAFFIIGRI